MRGATCGAPCKENGLAFVTGQREQLLTEVQFEVLSLRVKESEWTRLLRSADPLVRQLPQAVDSYQEGWHSVDLHQEETSAVLLHEWPHHCLVLAREGGAAASE